MEIGFIYPAVPLTHELFEILDEELGAAGFTCYRISDVADCRQNLGMVVMFGHVPAVENCRGILEHLYHRGIPVVLWEIEALPPAPLNRAAMVCARRINRAMDRGGIFRIGLVRGIAVNAQTSRLRQSVSEILGDRHVPMTDSAIRMMCRIYQWLHEAHEEGRIQKILVSVRSRSTLLRRTGIPTGCQPVGYHPRFGRRDVGAHRDIDVLFLGGLYPSRVKPLRHVESRLQVAGHALTIVSGDCHGDDRARLLNRTKILLNVLNHPWEFAGIRLAMALGNGCLVVSQSASDSHPYRSGEHFVMAEPGQLADTLLYYLEHEDEARRIADQGHAFVTGELTIANTIVAELKRLADDSGPLRFRPEPGSKDVRTGAGLA